MIVLKNTSGFELPWYVIEGQCIRQELKHFGRRAIVVVYAKQT